MKKLLIRLVSVVIILIMLFFGIRACSYLINTDESELIIQNHASEDILNFKVVVSGYVFTFDKFLSGETKSIVVHHYSDSSWEIEGEWQSGGKFKDSFGYITHGMSSRDYLIYPLSKKAVFSSMPLSNFSLVMSSD
jgi:hypothetical protein